MDARRNIPAVERLLSSDAFRELAAAAPHDIIVAQLQRIQDEVRDNPAMQPDENVAAWYAVRVQGAIDSLRASTLRTVINATGVVLHTNLGRAPLAHAAIEAMQRVAGGYSTLEYDAQRGGRGSRYTHCARLLQHLTGAGDALVVNNNAAALVLALNTFTRGKNAIVSRGELVEIGGSFRVPDIMARSGARMVEIGSTNRTHIEDYENAIDARAGALLKVHQSNFRVEGYTADVAYEKLAMLAQEKSLPLIYDLGSGLLDHAEELGLGGEPTARGAIAAGCTIVTLSGDKLLGGPQAGILLGDRERIAAMKKNPLCRALRVDKLTLAALEATLILHLDPGNARRAVPALRMLTMHADEIAPRAHALAAAICAGTGFSGDKLPEAGADVSTVEGVSAVGGGSAPGRELSTVLVRIRPVRGSTASLERRLRNGATPVVARIDEGAVLIDLRTVDPAEDTTLCNLIRVAMGSAPAP
jgi:L-seryl-tRNA(Ser) seleniumtransferase